MQKMRTFIANTSEISFFIELENRQTLFGRHDSLNRNNWKKIKVTKLNKHNSNFKWIDYFCRNNGEVLCLNSAWNQNVWLKKLWQTALRQTQSLMNKAWETRISTNLEILIVNIIVLIVKVIGSAQKSLLEENERGKISQATILWSKKLHN